MTPGEIHGLHARIVDDLKAQLAAAREDASNERTRAEAAEQDAREERMRADDLLLVVKHCHSSSTHAAVMRGLNPAVGSVLDNAGKLAAIRAHLHGCEPQEIANWASAAKQDSLLFQVLTAAREALEP